MRPSHILVSFDREFTGTALRAHTPVRVWVRQASANRRSSRKVNVPDHHFKGVRAGWEKYRRPRLISVDGSPFTAFLRSSVIAHGFFG